MAKTVLIVDDIPFVRKTLAKILTDARYQVIGEAADGNEAVNLFAKLKPDLVTLDIVMPNLSGIEAAKKMLRIDKEAKIVVISAMAQENIVMEAINVGAKDYILKPFTVDDVLKSLDRVFLAEQSVLGKAISKT